MISAKEIEAYVSKTEKNLIGKYEQQLYRIGVEGLIEFLRERGVLKDEPPPAGPTVMVRLPVVVDADGDYGCWRCFGSKCRGRWSDLFQRK